MNEPVDCEDCAQFVYENTGTRPTIRGHRAAPPHPVAAAVALRARAHTLDLHAQEAADTGDPQAAARDRLLARLLRDTADGVEVGA